MVYAAKNRKYVFWEGYGLKGNGISFDASTLLDNVRKEVSRLSAYIKIP